MNTTELLPRWFKPVTDRREVGDKVTSYARLAMSAVARGHIAEAREWALEAALTRDAAWTIAEGDAWMAAIRERTAERHARGVIYDWERTGI